MRVKLSYQLSYHWNGVSFFIDDNIITASDFHLFTDASSKIGYEGYFKERWFQGKWPSNLELDDESVSMAYMELYPIVIAAILWGHEWSKNAFFFIVIIWQQFVLLKRVDQKTKKL